MSGSESQGDETTSGREFSIASALSSTWTAWVRVMPRVLLLALTGELVLAPVAMWNISRLSAATAVTTSGQLADHAWGEAVLEADLANLVASAIATPCVVGACLVAVRASMRGRRPPLAQCLGRAVSRWPAVLGTGLLMGLLLWPVSIPLMLWLHWTSITLSELDAPDVAITMAGYAVDGFGLTLFWALLLPSTPALVEDVPRTAREALREMARLTCGVRLHVSVMLLVLWVLVDMMTGLVGLAVHAIGDATWSYGVAAVGTRILSTSLLAAASAVLCEHLRLVADGPEVDDLATTFA